MTLKKYIKYRESLDKEKKDKITLIEPIDIIIENKIKNLEKMIKSARRIRYNFEDEETSIND